ncbi:MAG TPA: hypothetical protein VF835_00375, partial [Rhizomicrobium sp.]
MKGVAIVLSAGVISLASAQPIPAVDGIAYREQVLHSFGGGTDGLYPSAAVIDVKGILSGTTSDGGNVDQGTV